MSVAGFTAIHQVSITKAWFGHDGAYYRENIEPTGAERDCGKDGRPPKTRPGEKYEGWYHDYYFTSGLETTAMMLDYVGYSGDAAFRDGVLAPFAREILLFFDRHYPRGADGKLRLEPAQVIETWWIAVNPATDIAGLRFCLDGLLAMKAGTPKDQARWWKLRGEVPEVPLQTIQGRRALAPAEKWEKKHNSENGELYPVFPFRCFGVALGTADVVELDDAASLLRRRLRLRLLDAGSNPLGLRRQRRRGGRRPGAPLPRRLADVPLSAVWPRRPGFRPRLGSLRGRLRRLAADARAGGRRQDPPVAGLAGRLGRRFPTAPAARRGAPRNRQGRQADRVGH